jgi:ADP-heptose:LPS heptosyltransferase
MNNTAIISKLNLFITNDTGVMHLASGFSIPVISLFGPTNVYEWGAIGTGKVSIQAFKGNMNNIETEKVYETGLILLNV